MKDSSAFPSNRVALVTGASSGIGAAIALRFAEGGYLVYGASRRGSVPTHVNCRPLIMDVSDERSISKGVALLCEEAGHVDILVHAAGDGIAGPIEVSTAEDASVQMEVNYYGALRLLNAVLPHMRAQKSGLVLLIGSVGGEFAIPYQTLYSGSKAALAMLSDGLRLELKPYGIRTVLIEPGDTKTGFTAARKTVASGCPAAYAAQMNKAVSRMERDEQNGMRPEIIARAAWRVAQQRRPGPRKVVGKSYALIMLLKRLLPGRWMERALYALYLR